LRPSEIKYLRFERLSELTEQLQNQIERGLRLTGSDHLPRLQVCQKNGEWFALNTTMLAVLQTLEEQNRCDKVIVQVVPLDKLPVHVQQQLMQPRTDQRTLEDDTNDSCSECSSCCSECANNTITTTISACVNSPPVQIPRSDVDDAALLLGTSFSAHLPSDSACSDYFSDKDPFECDDPLSGTLLPLSLSLSLSLL
jgi:hypothetical protein